MIGNCELPSEQRAGEESAASTNELHYTDMLAGVRRKELVREWRKEEVITAVLGRRREE